MASKPQNENGSRRRIFSNRAEQERAELAEEYAAFAAAGQLELLFTLSPIHRPYGWVSRAEIEGRQARAEFISEREQARRDTVQTNDQARRVMAKAYEPLMTLPPQSPRKPIKEVVETRYGPVEIEVSRGRGQGRGGSRDGR